MAEFPALPFWTDAYIADTAHLTNEEHGVYLRLLMFAWRTPGCSLPDNDKRLALMVGLSPKKWASIRTVIASFWDIENGTWTQKRLTREREFVTRQSEKGRDAAEARWGRKSLKYNDTGNAQASLVHMPERCMGDAPTPTPTVKEETDESVSKKKAKSSRRKAESDLPEGWIPSERNIQDAIAKNFTETEISHEASRFRDHHQSKGNRYRDWDAAWRTWLGNARKFAGGGMAGQAGSRGRGQGSSIASIVARRRIEGAH